jgi:hypothetical protein
MNEGTPVAQARRTWRWWGVFRVALALLWLFAAALSWWTAPQEQTYEQARAAVSAGHVTAYQWGDRWDASGQRWFGDAALQSSDTFGPLFAWRTSDGRVHWIDTDNFDQVSTTGEVDESSDSGAGAVSIAQDLRAAGLQNRTDDVESFGTALGWAGLFLGLVFLGVVVSGQAPVRGTRWYWFWLVYITPYGLGLLFWLARERPWSRAAAPSAVSGPERRSRGLAGLAIGIGAALLVSLLQLILHDVLGT